MEITKNRDGVEIISDVNPDGSGWSMLKSTYDAQQAATVASELSNPSTPQAGE